MNKLPSKSGTPSKAETFLWTSLRSDTQSYGLAVLGASFALVGSLLLDHFQYHVGPLLFFIAVTVTAWYAGVGPAMLALLLSSVGFIYFFVEPVYSFSIDAAETPSILIFIAFTVLVAWFSTLQRRSEANLRLTRDHLEEEVQESTQQASLLNLTHDSIFVRDMDDVITFWNHGAEELYGWKAEEAIGKSAHELLQTVFPMSIETIRSELVSTGRWDGEFEKTKADGTKVIVSSRWSLQRDELGQPVSILATNNDITEHKLRELEIQALNADLEKRTSELEATNKELEAFAYTVSHDLRAPVRHMLGFAELLQQEPGLNTNDKASHYQSQIIDSAKRMGRLIDDLLAFSQIARTESNTSVVNLNNLVQEALVEVKRETVGRNVLWNVDSLPSCYGDRSMLRIVLVNLISNAVKFTSTRPQAEIEIGCKDDDEDEIVVFVRDNGVGFDMKYQKKLFGVFQRLHSQDAFAGTGIGLATVRRIVSRHGGRVWAEAEVNRGRKFLFFTFEIIVPMRVGRILLVEDDSNDAELTMTALHKYDLGNDVVVARDGEEALDYLHCRGSFTGRSGGNPAVVLLDLKVPKIDGLEVLQQIRSDEELKLVPVVVLTSSKNERDVAASYAGGVNAYVVKPVDFQEFLNVIRHLGIFWTVINELPPGSFNNK